MLLMIDNYDSFTYTLVQYLGELGARVKTCRNDEITVEDVGHLAPSHVVISPGPCTPKEAGISVALIERYAGKMPILGVCLGHQSIAAAFGGKVVHAKRLMHGKTSPVHGEIMGLRHKTLPVEGVQFHPESILTRHGHDLLRNFLDNTV